MKQKFTKALIKIDRLAAWGLLATMVTYFISGYGMTKGIISAEVAVKLHNNILPLLSVVFFTIHTSYAVHLAFRRWRIWNFGTKVLLIVAYLAFLGGFVYVDHFYKRPVVTTNTTVTPVVQNTNSAIEEDDEDDGLATPTTSQSTTSTTPSSSTSQTFTLTDLAKYNGQNGNPAYVAVSGKIYDVSSLFAGGFHYSHAAGQDLTSAFGSAHGNNLMSRYPIVGILK